MKIYDITRTISTQMAVWPGDTPFSNRWSSRIDEGAAANVSSLTLSAHTGTHVDAPYHYAAEGIRLSEMPLDIHIGPATVVEIDARGELAASDFAGIDLDNIDRLLIKTPASQRKDEIWEDDFAYLSLEAAALLGEKRVRLFGTDAPSVDPVTTTDMAAHRVLFEGNVAILEAVQLCNVPPGDYELIALPLKIAIDGSPVRAILRDLSHI